MGREYHSPLQLRKRIQKKCSGLQTAVHCSSLRIKENLRCVSINASARVQHVTRWVFTLNFTKIFLPLVIIAFLTLLHPHTEIQLGVIAGIVFFIFTFALATRSLLRGARMKGRQMTPRQQLPNQPRKPRKPKKVPSQAKKAKKANKAKKTFQSVIS